MMTSTNCIMELPGSVRAQEREHRSSGGKDESECRPKRCFETPMRQRQLRTFPTLVIMVVLSIAAYFLFSRFVVMTVVVQGRSMSPTLRDGEHLMLNRMAFLMNEPTRGDLVVLKDPGYTDYAVKRVVGLPGDSLRFEGGEIFLNGRKLREVYLGVGLPTFTPDFKRKFFALAAGEYFVLGDNRGNSIDSRFYGAVRQGDILGLVSR